MRTRFSVFLFLVLQSSAILRADERIALDTFRSGDYKSAIPLLQSECAKSNNTPIIRAALLSALVYEGKVDTAADLAEELATGFPNSSDAIVARADFHYHMGDFGTAERLYKSALKLQDSNARAYLGLCRIFRAASLFRSARLMCLRAYQADPDDALVIFEFLRYASPELRNQKFGSFMTAHPWFRPNYERDVQTRSEVFKEVAERKAYEFEGERKQLTLHLINILSGANNIQGLGLEMRIEGGRPLHLLFDTGASGIVITQRAVDKAGLKHFGSAEHWGVGDGGARKAFVTIAESCSIGALTFKTCVFDAFEGKERIAGNEDGLIGADFFDDYLIHIDFQRHELKLTPLPPRSADPQGYDRTVPPGEENFTHVMRMGNHLFVPTKVNGSSTGLFLIDTGASLSNIDSTFARLSTKLHGNEDVRIRGVSGKVKEVFEADKAELQFARFRQKNLAMTAFNLNNFPYHQDVRLAGILGLPVLSMFRLDLDYRNGLVNFDYIFK